jgi:hypothetical protein
VLDPITHVYDNLYETLDANWYTPEEDLFTFPYDWRNSNVDTAYLLRDKINEIQEVCKCKKVDVVAHSMGGLVSRQYVQSEYYEDDINHLIFLGTPHLGAPKAYLMWEGGNFGSDSDILSLILKFVLTLEAFENGYPNLFQYIQNAPIDSVRELLPIYSYLFDESNNLKVYPNQYPTNYFLENLKDSISKLFLRTKILNIAADNLDDDTIVAIDTTASLVLPLWPHGMPIGLLSPLEPLGLVLGNGDATVPRQSATSQFLNSTILSGSHSAIPTFAQQHVYSALTGRMAVETTSVPAIERILMFRIFSPADMTIVDPNGRRVGRDGASTINEIPRAYYTGFSTETEFIVIPDPMDGEYQVQALGTGEGGEFRITTNYITDSGYAEDSYVGSVAQGEIEESIADLNTTQESPLDIHPLDEEPPVITILSPTAIDYTRSALLDVDFTVTDDDSGVVSVNLLLDGEVFSDDPIDLFYHSLGNHTFAISAADNLGNETTTQVEFRAIATPESAIQDIERSFTLGWI